MKSPFKRLAAMSRTAALNFGPDMGFGWSDASEPRHETLGRVPNGPGNPGNASGAAAGLGRACLGFRGSRLDRFQPLAIVGAFQV